jgi:hypothetical protein
MERARVRDRQSYQSLRKTGPADTTVFADDFVPDAPQTVHKEVTGLGPCGFGAVDCPLLNAVTAVDAPPAVDAVTAGGDEPVLTKPESGQLAGEGSAVDAEVQLGPLNDPGRGRVRNVVWG